MFPDLLFEPNKFKKIHKFTSDLSQTLLKVQLKSVQRGQTVHLAYSYFTLPNIGML